jgi:hypothetical protein
MTIEQGPTVFHQSIRFFRPGNPEPMRTAADDYAHQWQSVQRHVSRPPERATEDRSPMWAASARDAATSGLDARIDDTSEYEPKNISKFDHSVGRQSNQSGYSPLSVNLVGKVGKAQSSAVQSSVQPATSTNDRRPIPRSDPVNGTANTPYANRSIDTQARPPTNGWHSTSIRQPDPDTVSHASAATTMVPVSSVVVRGQEESANKIAAGPDPLRSRAFMPFDVTASGRSDADRANTTTKFASRATYASGITPATPRNSFPSTSNVSMTASSESEPGRNSSRSEDFDVNESGKSRQSDSSATSDQSSSVVGELWLDALSLREWLQAYLNAELGHALQATNQFGNAFE